MIYLFLLLFIYFFISFQHILNLKMILYVMHTQHRNIHIHLDQNYKLLLCGTFKECTLQVIIVFLWKPLSVI